MGWFFALWPGRGIWCIGRLAQIKGLREKRHLPLLPFTLTPFLWRIMFGVSLNLPTRNFKHLSWSYWVGNWQLHSPTHIQWTGDLAQPNDTHRSPEVLPQHGPVSHIIFMGLGVSIWSKKQSPCWARQRRKWLKMGWISWIFRSEIYRIEDFWKLYTILNNESPWLHWRRKFG